MTTAYEKAVAALYQAPHESFVSKRSELSAELKGSGDKASAARLTKIPRPSISAWAVNQLWWHARAAFDELFSTAEQVRAGKAQASGAHRQAISKLSARAKQLLREHEHAGNEATLRRVTMTLSALAATGSWDPEQPGMLSKDLDPPGFEAFGMGATSESDSDSEPASHAEHTAPAKPAKHETLATHGNASKHADAKAKPHADAKAKQQAEDEAKRERERARAAEAAEKKRLAEQRIAHEKKKDALASALRAAKTALTALEHDRDRAAKALKAAEHEVERAEAKVEAAELELREHASRS